MSDGDAQPRLIRFQQCRALVRVERLLLPQHSRGDGGDRDPGLRAIRLDLLEISHSRLRLLEAPESHQRGPEPAIGQRHVGGLPQGVAQESLGFGRTIGTQGERRKSAKRCHVIRILSEDFAEQLLRLAALIRHECRRRRLDPRPLRVGQPGALEGHERIGVLFELDEHVAVGKPRAVMVRVGLEHAPYLCARELELARATISPRKIDARIGELRLREHDSLERLEGRGGLVLVEQCDTEQSQALYIAGRGRLDGAQLPLGRGGSPEAQRRQCLGVGRTQTRLGFLFARHALRSLESRVR